MTSLYNKLLQDIPGTQDPVMPTGNFLKSVVDQVNRNTIAIAPPRGVLDRDFTTLDDAIVNDSDSEPVTAEDSQAIAVDETWTEVDKTYEEVEVDGVTIRRRTLSTFDTGTMRVQMIFDNSDT